MSDILKKVMDQLEACKLPSYDDLEAALLAALNQGAHANQVASDMARWLNILTEAHLKRDAHRVAETMDAFVRERVKIVDHTNQSGSMH